MKKSYMLMALCAAATMNVTAAPQKALENTDSRLMQSKELQAFTAESRLEMKKAPARIANAEDAAGVYAASYRWMFDPKEYKDPNGGVFNPCFVYAGDNEFEVYGWNIFDDPIQATVDASTGKITFPKQVIGFSDKISGGPNEPTKSSNLVLVGFLPDAEGKYVETETGAIEATIEADGTINFGNYMVAFYWQELSSYNAAWDQMTFAKKDFYNVDLSEWTKCEGTGMYKEGWVSPMLDGEIDPEPVDIYVNNKNNKLVAIANPYASERWGGLNTPPAGQTNTGYIVFDLSEESCVPVHPLTASGLWLDLGDAAGPQQLYMFNQEGFKIYEQGYTAEDLINEALDAYVDPEEIYSYYEAETRTVNFTNLFFGQTINPLGTYFWIDASGQAIPLLDRKASVVLPEGWNSGVESVEFDSNAPVKYFNLQGVEVANPEAGQIVIKKQGSKAVKVVVK